MEPMRTPPPTSNAPHSALPPPDPHVVALARQCLEEIDSLVDEWAEYVGPVRASYSDMVSQQEFRDSAWQAFELLLRTVARLPVPDHVAGVSGRVGEQRARQGVPLDALMQAARVDFRVVRAALVRRAGDEGRARLVTSAHYVWEAVEHHVTGIMTAYQRTVLEMGRRTEDERRLWFSRLLDSGGRNPTVSTGPATSGAVWRPTCWAGCTREFPRRRRTGCWRPSRSTCRAAAPSPTRPRP